MTAGSVSANLHQRRAPAVREASTSSADEDRKISGSNGAAPASSSRPTRPSLAVNTDRSSDGDKKHKRGHIQKHEKIERIGLLRGSSYVKSTDKDSVAEHELTTSIGLQDDAVYDAYLPRPIAFLRRIIVAILRKEAPIHERHQNWIRRPWLDRYFVNTSLLGTHSFFLVFLPMVFWLGSPRFGRGLINVLAFGVYISSAIKDLFCIPRPYSPPVTRLTVGTHHLEYGFPSTHSTNSVSIALYIYLWVRKMREAAQLDSTGSALFDSWLWEAGLLFYATSVVYGRIYAGMHSIIDCIAGSALGAAITAVQWGFFDQIEQFVKINSWTVPIAIIPAGLLMVSVHPQPVDDCPCFEDAIAFISVAMGVALARWTGIRYGMVLNTDPLFHPFSKLVDPLAGYQAANITVPTTPLIQIPVAGAAERWIKRGLVMVIGLVNVLLLRVIVKTACKVILPPTFRLVDELIGFSLPRRHYTPASDYKKIPLADLSAVPSVLDLPSQIIVTDESGNQQTIQSPVWSPTSSRRGSADPRYGLNGSFSPLSTSSPLLGRSPMHSPVPSRTPSPNPIEMRRALSPAGRKPKSKIQFTIGTSAGDDEDSTDSPVQQDLPIPLTQSRAHPNFIPPDEQLARNLAADVKGTTPKEVEKEVKHYDADVLTKVIVYTNIGLFSAGFIPALFQHLGLC
ncbi:Phosphatidic acid phosphatase type 2/haloperoxidase [Kalmanozyma brasiliensis GHG001]|uniref:Phosphatidic acid phosphatase type 2/haloperoxidase domain-containing protein n=1 Tax=Kalmanozyma brasiliensis (strain GHG001) TaxID=1365824 RepID=V5EVT6_KALBG|nr:Phosphatidic acid phosphatase type 2/haloperoxidase [Kalmanozyma brasiliensis GHG001]EST09595.1 Phosphatidic acid phosphatase type 2/haloperoxidase [Kalmanozyma brasiliensis GHG001]